MEVRHYREGLERIETGELPQSFKTSYQVSLEREINRAAEIAVDGDNQYMRDVAKSDQELQRAIELIELSRSEARRIAEREQRGADRTYRGGEIKGAAGGSPGVVGVEQAREADRVSQPTPEQDRDGVDRQNSPASGQERENDKRLDDSLRTSAEVAPSDPPQQHVPRLRQVELDIEKRHDRDRDDRER